MGQTENDPVAHRIVIGSLVVAAAATIAAVAAMGVQLGGAIARAPTGGAGLTPAQREITASLGRLRQMRQIMARLVAAYQHAIERNLPVSEQLARQAIENQAQRIAAEEAWFEFLLGGLP